MSDMLPTIIPLAFGAAVSPTLIILLMVILSSPDHPRSRGAVFIGGGLLVLIAMSVLFVVAMKPATDTSDSGSTNKLLPILDLIFAGLLALLAVRTALRPPRHKEQKPDDPAKGAALARYAALGAGAMTTNVTTIVLYGPAMKQIALDSHNVATTVTAVALVIVITLFPLWVPLALDVFVPGPASRILGALHRFLTVHTKVISVAVAGAFAVFLALKGIKGLAG